MVFRWQSLAGVPDSVTDRAKEIVEELVQADITVTDQRYCSGRNVSRNTKQRSMMRWIWHRCHCLIPSKMMMYLQELKNLDVTNLTPIDALNTLYQLQNKL